MRIKKNSKVIAVHPWTMNICVSFIYQPHGGIMSHLSLAGHPVAMNICSSHVPQRGFTPVTFHLHDKKPVNQSNYSLSTQWLHRKKHLKIPWKACLVFCNLWSECDVAPDTFPFQHELYKYTRGSKRMSWKYNKFKKINPFKICQHGLCGCGRYSDWNKRLCSVAWDVALKCHIHGLNPPGICWNLHCVLWEKEKNCQWPCSFILCWRKFSDGTSKPFCMIALQFRANTLCLL